MSDTEAEAVAALAAQPAAYPVTPGEVETIAYPPEWTISTLDHERFNDRPRRPVANVQVRDAAGFTAAVQQRKFQAFAVYADDESMALTAILNDDYGQTAGWRDNRVVLALRPTPEWTHWKSLDGSLVDQKAFALHVEDGLKEIIRPSAADMLDLAQTFQATTAAKFKGGQRLATGERQFTYEEDIDAKAGSAGQVAIPDTFTLRISPFFGAAAVDIDARFRFQLRAAELKLGYKLDRPDDVARQAFRTCVEDVAEALDVEPVNGVAPSAR